MFNLLKRVKTTLAVLVMSLFLNACSQGFIYDQVPRIILWEFNDYVTLNDTQEEQFMEIIRELMTVQREEHFAIYIAWIDDIDRKVMSNSMTMADMMRWYREGSSYRTEVLALVAPIAADYVLGFSLAQREEFVANLREELEREIEDRAEKTNAQWQQQWAEERIESTEERIGALSETQKNLISVSVLEQIETMADYQAYQLAWLDGFEAALMADDRGRLIDVMENYKQFYSASYRTKRQLNRTKGFRDLVTLMGTLTPPQRQRVNETLMEWKDLLTGIQDIR